MNKLLFVLMVLAILFAVLVAAVSVITPRVSRYAPIQMAGDWMTNYGANATRHRNAQQLATPWDPIGENNRRIDAIPMEDRAYPLLADAAAMIEAAGVRDLLRTVPGEEGWDEALAWIATDEAQAIVRVLEAAAAKPHSAIPLTDAPEPIWEGARERHGLEPKSGTPTAHPLMLGVMLGHLSASRSSVAVLILDAERARLAGDADRYVADVRTALRLVTHSTEIKALIELLVRYVVTARTNASVQGVLLESPGFLGETHAAAIAEAYGALADAGLLIPDFRGESAAFEDAFRRFIDANGVFDAANARATQSMLADQVLISVAPSSVVRSSIHPDILDAIIKAEGWCAEAARRSGVPFRAGPSIDAEVQAYVDEPSGLVGIHARAMVGIMFPGNLDQIIGRMRLAPMEVTAIRVALAAHRHRLRHGDPPQNIGAIDPDLMAFDPIDGFTGGPLQFRWRDAGPFVYACGPDLDDDGGRHLLDEEGHTLRDIPDALLASKPDGDFVLFPAPER